MAEPLKLMYSDEKLKELSAELKKHNKKFDEKLFLGNFKTRAWKDAELKARVTIISIAIHEALGPDYEKNIEVLIPVSWKFKWGFFGVFFSEYVERCGMDHWQTSMKAFEEFTQTSTAEFSIRKFIRKDPKRAMKQMLLWSKSKNHHLRRLSSEGCRPRLPWGMKLDEFVADPKPVIEILEVLKKDKELYVMKSVANNLNDISKDHPEVALKLAREWKGKNENTDWIVKHGMRTLLKKGNKQALSLFNHHDSEGIVVNDLNLSPAKLKIGDELVFSFQVINEKKRAAELRVEFAVDYVKSTGKLSRKIFHVTKIKLENTPLRLTRKLKLTDYTTRKHYPGVHHIHILVNGEVKASDSFKLS